MHLLDLPDEILEPCCPETELRNLRLTCKRFAILSSKSLFAHLRLLPTTKSAEKLQCILDGPLAALVNSITLQASTLEPGCRQSWERCPAWNVDLDVDNGSESDPPNTNHEYRTEPDNETLSTVSTDERELSTIIKRTLSQIGRLPNLRHIELIYDDRVSKIGLLFGILLG